MKINCTPANFDTAVQPESATKVAVNNNVPENRSVILRAQSYSKEYM